VPIDQSKEDIINTVKYRQKPYLPLRSPLLLWRRHFRFKQILVDPGNDRANEHQNTILLANDLDAFPVRVPVHPHPSFYKGFHRRACCDEAREPKPDSLFPIML